MPPSVAGDEPGLEMVFAVPLGGSGGRLFEGLCALFPVFRAAKELPTSKGGIPRNSWKLAFSGRDGVNPSASQFPYTYLG
jgi:hypothetical protein